MKHMVLGSLLLFIASAMAQTQGNPQPGPPLYSTPSTFSQAPVSTGQMPPDTKAPPSEQLSAADSQDQIQNKLDSEPALNNNDLKATVDDASVALDGTVQNEQQHALALRIAQSYAGERRIVDNIEIEGERE
jgi:osmotically-inducible protein OsmY